MSLRPSWLKRMVVAGPMANRSVRSLKFTILTPSASGRASKPFGRSQKCHSKLRRSSSSGPGSSWSSNSTARLTLFASQALLRQVHRVDVMHLAELRAGGLVARRLALGVYLFVVGDAALLGLALPGLLRRSQL